DERVDARIGLAEPGLVRIDDLLDEFFESVRRLFMFPGANEAFDQDPVSLPRAQPAGVLDQLGIGGADVLAPQVPHELRELLVIKPEAVFEGLVHVIQGDRADAAALPDVAQARVDLPGWQPEPSLPPPVHAKIRGYLEDTANVEHHRPDHHEAASSASRVPATHVR